MSNPIRPDRTPMTQLERCHRRLEEACDALAMAAERQDIETASDVCSFLQRQVRRHELDEETSLFPRLLAAGASVELRGFLDRLTAEHREHEALHTRLEDAVSGRFEGDVWAELGTLAGLLTQAYRAHLEIEEKHVFPAANELLTAEAVEAMGVEMDARRGR